MEMEQMMACLLADIKAEIRTNQAEMEANQAKMEASQREMRQEMRAGQELMKEEMLTKMATNQEMMITKMNAHQERMDSWLEILEAFLEKMEAMEVIESELGHQEVTKEEATVQTFGALKKRYGDRHLAVGRQGQPKKRTRGNGGSRKKLATSHGGITHRAVPPRH
jgi:hypothetical protein